MCTMNKKATIIATSLFVLIIVGMFAASFILRQKVTNVAEAPIVATEEIVEPLRINGVHTFSNGKHTVLAELETGSTCALVETTSNVTKGARDEAIINLQIIESDDANCVRQPTMRRFLISFEAGKDAHITAKVDSNDAILNLVEQDSAKTLDINDEFFFKG